MATICYDIGDRPTGIYLGNSTMVTPSFDLLNRLGSVDNALASVNRNYGYSYDGASRITSITEPRGTIGIGSYSTRNEVKGITEPGGSPFASQSFTYDAAFNRSTWTLGSGSPTSYTPNSLNEYTAVGTATPTWNSDGGLTTFASNTYTYDALSRLTEVDNSSNKVYYAYDPFGRRTSKTVKDSTGCTTLATYGYHYDGGQVAVEYQPSATWTYYLGLGGPALRVLFVPSEHDLVHGVHADSGGSPPPPPSPPSPQWYYRDGQGSVSAVADSSGNLLEAYEYSAQGQSEIIDGTGTVLTGTGIGNDLMYAGYRNDPETGNYYCNARYYNPTLGRFISRDPLGGAEFSQGTNLYAYCGNDSANLSDPSGMGPIILTYSQWRNGDGGDGDPGQYTVVPDPGPSAQIDSRGPNRKESVIVLPGLTPGAQQVINDALRNAGGNLDNALTEVISMRMGHEQNKDLRDADHFLTAANASDKYGLFGYFGMGVDIFGYAAYKYGLGAFNLLDANTTPADLEEIEAGSAGDQFGLNYNNEDLNNVMRE